jgi:FKBP-type peptidyl-prolyl cis-trans isomerase/outer membrane protein assembly factor BamB
MNDGSRFSRRLSWLNTLLTVAAYLLASFPAQARTHVQVLTRAYDNQRTAANLSEKTLKPSNVNTRHFGKLFMLPVDDQIYAGLLYAAGVRIAGGKHNVLYVATVNNSVYAFDADRFGAPLWYRNFNSGGRPSRNTEVGQACKPAYKDFIGNIGIVGTPVIGPDRTMYFVTRTVEGAVTVQRLHAIDITTGADRPHSPLIVEAKVRGSGDGSSKAVSMVSFNARRQNQRPALSLSNGTLYVGWASFCDTRPYHGWMISYDASTLAQTGVLNTSPDGNMAGIWMSGAGPAFDQAGNIYFTTGNGTFDGVHEFGESLVKAEAKSLRPLDFFTPSSFNTLNDFDLDFGSVGPTILPGSHFLVTGGKEGKLYLLDAERLGGQSPGDIQIPQVVQAVDTTVRPMLGHHIHNAIPAWKSPQGLNVYVWGESDFLRIFRFDPAVQKFAVPSAATGSILTPSGMPGGMMTISANGSHAGTGILWATLPRVGDANRMTVPGVLYAFNAEDLSLLWSSNGPGDDPLNFAKGSPPIVANGKVYVASISNFVSVYGLKKRAAEPKNLALHARASGSASCYPNQTPDKAFNGSSESGPDDKWCSSAVNPFLQVDLGHNPSIGRFVVEHAGAGGDDLNLNTRDFNIQVSVDGVNFTTVASVTDNIQSITTHDIPPTAARYVRLNVLAPAKSAAAPANIFELQVFAAPLALQQASDSDKHVGDPDPATSLKISAGGSDPVKTPQDPPQETRATTPSIVSSPGPTPANLLPAARPSAMNPHENKDGNKPAEQTNTGQIIVAPTDVAAPPADAQRTATGLAMKLIKRGSDADHPAANDCVTVSFKAWKRDGDLFSTSTPMNDSDVLCLNAAIVGVSEALKEMSVGEKRRLWVPAELTFMSHHYHGQERPEDEGPPHQDLTFDLELLSILKAPPTPGDLKQPPATALRTPSGLAYQVLKSGTGTTRPSARSTVTVHFAAWQNDGRLFESTLLANHPAQVSLATAPEGWRQALCTMVAGEKTRFWIPANLAFGEKPANRFDPPGDLLYEIELLSVH